jgi:uncharacterized protein (TIGR02145 family)
MRRILLIALLLSSFYLYSQEPVIKIDIGNGNYKTYNLSDIQNISLTNFNNNASLWIYYQKTKTISLSISSIDSIKFESEESNISNLVFYYAGTTPKSFKLSEIDYLKVTERLLGKFDTVKIGTQVWMTKNLDIDHYWNGEPIPQVTDSTQWVNLKTGAWCNYNNDKVNGEIYGKLYNWYAVNDSQRLAPLGWHIPTTSDWTQLFNFLGDSASGKLKEKGTSHWKSPNKDADNSSGFTAVGGGYRDNKFYALKDACHFWTSLSWGETPDAEIFRLFANYKGTIHENVRKFNGLSVRCIKDSPPNIYNVKPIYSKIGDEITIVGNWYGANQDSNTVTINGINALDYTYWSDNIIKFKVPAGATTGNLSVNVYGVKSNDFNFTIVPDSSYLTINNVNPTSVYVGNFITIKGTGFGINQDTNHVLFNNTKAIYYLRWSDTQIEVKVPAGSSSGKLSLIINGSKSQEFDYTIIGEFETVTIGNQVWTKNNLEVDHYQNGDSIPEVRDSTQWKNLKTGAWCYYSNNLGLPQKFNLGKLYNWYAVKDPRGLAPKGYHIPSEQEWKTLTDFLGGESVAGSKMKAAGNTIWDFPNKDATNSSGFSGLPGGCMGQGAFSYSFNGIFGIGFWWSSTEKDDANAFYRDLDGMWPECYSDTRTKDYGYSVRCVKD